MSKLSDYVALAQSGVTAHDQLTGLANDDHMQYHNNARGDARYSVLGHSHAALLPSGGTVGQILEKIDSADFNAQWATPAAAGGATFGTWPLFDSGSGGLSLTDEFGIWTRIGNYVTASFHLRWSAIPVVGLGNTIEFGNLPFNVAVDPQGATHDYIMGGFVHAQQGLDFQPSTDQKQISLVCVEGTNKFRPAGIFSASTNPGTQLFEYNSMKIAGYLAGTMVYETGDP